MRRALAMLVLVTGLTTLLMPTLPATAQEAFKQIRLSDKQVQGFIASQKDMLTIAEKMQGSGSDAPDPKMQAELETAAKKHGFANFQEYDEAAANITMIMMAIDPKTGAFTDPVDAIKKDIELVKTDTTINDKERKLRLEELQEELKMTEPVKFPENIEIVKKNQAKIAEVMK